MASTGELKIHGRSVIRMSRIMAGVIGYKVYINIILVDTVHFPEGGKYLRNLSTIVQKKLIFGISDLDYVGIH